MWVHCHLLAGELGTKSHVYLQFDAFGATLVFGKDRQRIAAPEDIKRLRSEGELVANSRRPHIRVRFESILSLAGADQGIDVPIGFAIFLGNTLASVMVRSVEMGASICQPFVFLGQTGTHVAAACCRAQSSLLGSDMMQSCRDTIARLEETAGAEYNEDGAVVSQNMLGDVIALGQRQWGCERLRSFRPELLLTRPLMEAKEDIWVDHVSPVSNVLVDEQQLSQGEQYVARAATQVGRLLCSRAMTPHERCWRTWVAAAAQSSRQRQPRGSPQQGVRVRWAEIAHWDYETVNRAASKTDRTMLATDTSVAGESRVAAAEFDLWRRRYYLRIVTDAIRVLAEFHRVIKWTLVHIHWMPPGMELNRWRFSVKMLGDVASELHSLTDTHIPLEKVDALRIRSLESAVRQGLTRLLDEVEEDTAARGQQDLGTRT